MARKHLGDAITAAVQLMIMYLVVTLWLLADTWSNQANGGRRGSVWTDSNSVTTSLDAGYVQTIKRPLTAGT